MQTIFKITFLKDCSLTIEKNVNLGETWTNKSLNSNNQRVEDYNFFSRSSCRYDAKREEFTGNLNTKILFHNLFIFWNIFEFHYLVTQLLSVCSVIFVQVKFIK